MRNLNYFESGVFPITANVNADDHMVLGGCDVTDLVKEYGTPLYILDESTVRDMCRQFLTEFKTRYENTTVLYAAKAFINPALAKLFQDEGLGMDVVSGGELAVAVAVDFVQENIYFHGNNKTPAELNMALDNQTGTIVVDNLDELRLLNELAGGKNKLQKIMLRVSPSVDPHTHVKTTTGTLDSKFGMSIQNGQATQALLEAIDMVNLDLAGLHFHLGSPIYELEPYSTAIDIVLNFAAKFETNGFELREFSPGGGFAIAYTHDEPPPLISSYADTITSSVINSCRNLNLVEPKIVIESGRALIGRSGVAVYSVGTTKDIPGIRKYVSLDGGMGDNIRPALYGSRYEAVLANRMSDPRIETVTLAGKFCESGDVLINDIKLPLLKPDDIIAIPACGAYAPSMASNYNLNPRPPVILVKDGEPRMIRRRETYEDMMLCDV